ncbi:hypothetical protein OQA88_2407 [Cercophora sp. LCS_1]
MTILIRTGKPSPNCFPFSGMSIKLKDADTEIQLSDKDLHDAFQYALMPGGLPELRQWFESFQAKLHDPGPAGTWGCGMGSGSQDLLYKAFQVFTDPGDSVLIDTPAYSGVLGFLKADGHDLIGKVATARDSIQRRRFGIYCAREDSETMAIQQASAPSLIEILRLAKEHDFLIFEDDAYYFLDFASSTTKPRSYLALESQVNNQTGRVLRFDSMSKIMSAGLRLGFLTTSLPILNTVNMITGNTNLQPPSTSQVIALSILRQWGHSGFLAHAARTADFYRCRRDALLAAAEKHLREKARWEAPQAGMFLWLELQLPPGRDTLEILSKYAVQAGVIGVPGTAFMPGGGKTRYLRLSYSLLGEEEADEACRRISRLVELVVAEDGMQGC